MSVLDDETVRGLILAAWRDSQPGTGDAHEEGGFVLQNADGSLSVERWPRGAQNEILVPPHPAGTRRDLVIVATFHTHPNFGTAFQQEPSLTDIRAVRDDPDLGHLGYEGEYVISTEWTYRIDRSGKVESVAQTTALLQSR